VIALRVGFGDGQTEGDCHGAAGRAPNATVPRKLDAPGFFGLLRDRLAAP
jgi:inosine-uridine nucleoside N-ribohydrolase